MYDKMASSIFTIYNFFDEISIIDTEGIIQYCEIINPGTYSFTADEIIGKHFFEVFPTSNEESSEIYRVLKTGKPVSSFEENCMTYKGDIVKGYSSVYPLFKRDQLIGAAVALKFFDSKYDKEFIQVQGNSSARSVGSSNYSLDDIITADPYTQKLKQKIKKVANTDSAVLIQGKTGTGKELVAQSLHFTSHRASKPFISQNCSAIPGNLLESTLFGTEKGSFTGAITNKGLFELAHGGTLFLDEINSMDPQLQSKLLKAIEEKSIRRLGGHDNIRVNVRIVAAINEDPFISIENYRLRSDLFYRLNVISLTLTDLKDRKDDISLLSNYYIGYYRSITGKQICGLTSEVTELFRAHSWPGNVRELRNIIEGAFAIGEGKFITVDDLPDYLTTTLSRSEPKQESVVLEDEKGFVVAQKDSTQSSESFASYQQQVEAFERHLLQCTLDATATKTEAAKKLGISRQALNHKLNRLEIKSYNSQ